MMDFFEVLHKRKSVRSFKPSSVSRDLVEKILEVAVYAPTNCNQQLWNFVVVEDTSVKECLIKEAASNTLIRRAPMLIVVSYDWVRLLFVICFKPLHIMVWGPCP